jgi:hypothetical protein
MIASLTVLLFLVPAFRAVETLPAQLSDSEFWGLVSDSSEDGGTFLSENFLSNERGFQYVIPPLLQKIQSGGVYMGVVRNRILRTCPHSIRRSLSSSIYGGRT